MSITVPPGVFDILPEDDQEKWKSSYIWQYVEEIIRNTASLYGFEEIRTPIFERAELFHSIGETTDIVSKEMYLFEDKGKRKMALRPEGTAPTMRAFIEHHLDQKGPIQKLYYICPMFRYERAQAGRYRQHHQFGVEAIGNASPEQDVEVIDLLFNLFQRLGLKNLEVNINSLGTPENRQHYKKALLEYLKNHFEELSPESKKRFENNPLRFLDSKDPRDQEIAKGAPLLLDYLDSESRDHFEAVKSLLSSLKIPFIFNPNLVRGLDYYNKTVFEVTALELGAQNSIGGGGRYDGLLKSLGGPDLPSLGFGSGIERIIQTLIGQQVTLPQKKGPFVFLITLGEEAKRIGFQLLHRLRQTGISCQMDFTNRKLNKIMQYVNQIQAQSLIVIGDQELQSGKVEMKEMKTGQKATLPLEGLEKLLKIQQQSDLFIRIWEQLDQPFEHQQQFDYFYQKLTHSIELTKKISQNLHEAFDQMKGLLNGPLNEPRTPNE